MKQGSNQWENFIFLIFWGGEFLFFLGEGKPINW
jgi:hypothetical protein